MKKSCVYPGSFDPFHNGHLEVIYKAASLFDEISILVCTNSSKKHMFTTEERVKLARECFESKQRVITVDVLGEGVLVTDFMKALGIRHMIRGLRNPLDFMEEERLLKVYRSQHSHPVMESVFFMSNLGEDTSYLSSSLIKEVARCNGKWDQWVPKHIEKAILEKLK